MNIAFPVSHCSDHCSWDATTKGMHGTASSETGTVEVGASHGFDPFVELDTKNRESSSVGLPLPQQPKGESSSSRVQGVRGEGMINQSEAFSPFFEWFCSILLTVMDLSPKRK